MSDINSAIGIHQLKKIDRFLTLRKKYTALYDLAFNQIPELETLQTKEYAEPSHHLYIISLRLEQLTVSRDQFIDAIQSTGIGVAVHYKGLHLQPYYQKEFGILKGQFPVATHYSERVISLPLYPLMSTRDIERVIGVVTDLIVRYRS